MNHGVQVKVATRRGAAAVKGIELKGISQKDIHDRYQKEAEKPRP
jgi:hypothetical protein